MHVQEAAFLVLSPEDSPQRTLKPLALPDAFLVSSTLPSCFSSSLLFLISLLREPSIPFMCYKASSMLFPSNEKDSAFLRLLFPGIFKSSLGSKPDLKTIGVGQVVYMMAATSFLTLLSPRQWGGS